MQIKKILIIVLILLFVPSMVWGTTLYVDNTANGYCASCSTPSDNDYDAGIRDCGSGALTVYNSINGGLDAAGEGDTLIITSGTYTYSNGSELDYKKVDDNQTVMGTDRDTVILDFNSSGDGGGWLYGSDDFTLKNLTVKDVGVYLVLNWTNGTGWITENINFIDSLQRNILINNSSGTVRNCSFKGNITTAASIQNSSISLVKNTGTMDVKIYNNIFYPSATNRGSGIWIGNTFDINDTIDIYHNDFMGVNKYCIYFDTPITALIENNIILGGGLESYMGSYSIWRSAAADLDNTTVNYNLSLGGIGRGYAAEISPGSNEIHDLSGISAYPRYGHILIHLDDASAVAYDGLDNLKTLMDEFGWYATWMVNVEAWVNDYAITYNTYMAEWINDGHDINSHTWSHSDLDVTTNAVTIYNDSGSTLSVTISCDTDHAGNPDWNSIYKDYTDWTGTITLERAAGGDDSFNLVTGGSGDIKTLEELEVQIDALTDWHAATNSPAVGYISSSALAVCLSDINTNILASGNLELSIDQTEFLWAEVKYSKDKLEAAVDTALGSGSYTVTSWGCPYHNSNAALMDALEEAGYVTARGEAGQIGLPEWDLTDLARYSLVYDSPPIDSDELIDYKGKMSYLAIMGGIYSIPLHTSDIDTAGEVAIFRSLLNDLKTMENKNAIYVKSFTEFGTWLLANSTITAGEGDGSDERRKVVFTDQSDFTLQPNSFCIDAGVDLGATYKLDFSSSDQYGDGRWDIGTYRFLKWGGIN